MSILEGLSKLMKFPVKNIVPFVRVQGYINSQKVYQLTQKLNSIPKSSKKIVVVVNSHGGQPSQALLIADRLKAKSKEFNAQIFTFSEQLALNSGFFLLSQGHKVYADKSAFIGGLEIGISKENYGLLSQYIKKCVYTGKSSYFAQLESAQSIQESKKEEMREIFKYFTQQMKNRIMKSRKISQQADLKQIYFGEQAKNLGLIDDLGRVNDIIPKIVEDAELILLKKSKKGFNFPLLIS